MSDKPFNPASVVDANPVGLLDGCWPKGDPFSLDAGKWAQAFLRSGDWTRPYRAYKWFHNVIAVARTAGPMPEPED